MNDSETKNDETQNTKGSDENTCECGGACDETMTDTKQSDENETGANTDTNADSDKDAETLAETNAMLLKDIQRLQADFENYRKRIDKERHRDANITKSVFVEKLLPLLDSCGQARKHGELTGAFELVAKKLNSILEQAGLQPFGEVGEAFDPTRHEAISVVLNNSLPDHSITEVLQIGYTFQGKIIRVAKVIITDNFDPPEAA